MIDVDRLPAGVAGGDYALAAGKSAPPVAVSTAIVTGYALPDWIVILTVVFLLLQIAHLVYKFARDIAKDRRDGGG